MFVEYLCGGLMIFLILAFHISIKVYLPTKKKIVCVLQLLAHIPFACMCARVLAAISAFSNSNIHIDILYLDTDDFFKYCNYWGIIHLLCIYISV